MTTTLSASVNGQSADGAQPALGETFRVGDWLVLPRRNRIELDSGLKSSLSRHLEPRLMHLLCFLAANQGEVVSRDELVQELWPRVIVNENSLTRAVSELRKSLAVPGRANTPYIETIPKNGYRLLPAVSGAGAVRKSRFSTMLPPLFPDLGRPQQLLLAAFCLSLVFDFWPTPANPQLPEQSVALPPLADVVVTPETDLFGGIMSLSSAQSPWQDARALPVVAADGERFAFIANRANGATIYLGSLGSDEAPAAVYRSSHQLTGLTWSPVGNKLLFARVENGATRALFEADSAAASTVLSLDLDEMALQRLVEAPLLTAPDPGSDLRLT